MTKQNKSRREQATLEEMVKTGSQLILMHDDGTEQPIEEIIEANHAIQDDPYANEFRYKRGGTSSEAPGYNRRRWR